MSNETDIISKIGSAFIESGRDPRYRPAAYIFVLQGLEFCFAKIGEKKHVSGQKLSECLAQFAHRQFGPLAFQVLQWWGVRATDDFGFIVYNLIEIGVMSKTASDSVGDFFNVFDLKDFFSKIDYFPVDKKHVGILQGA